MTATPIRVLVVDDDAVWRRVIRHTLDKHNVNCIEADCLRAAADALIDSEFDLVLLDYELPDGEGLDILDQFDRSRMRRVVLVTGFADRQDLGDERSAAVDGYLTKPFLSSDLVALLEGLGTNDQEPLDAR